MVPLTDCLEDRTPLRKRPHPISAFERGCGRLFLTRRRDMAIASHFSHKGGAFCISTGTSSIAVYSIWVARRFSHPPRATAVPLLVLPHGRAKVADFKRERVTFGAFRARTGPVVIARTTPRRSGVFLDFPAVSKEPGCDKPEACGKDPARCKSDKAQQHRPRDVYVCVRVRDGRADMDRSLFGRIRKTMPNTFGAMKRSLRCIGQIYSEGEL